MQLFTAMIGLLFILIPADAFGDAESYAEILQKITGIRSGTSYAPAPDASSECLSGELEIVDAGPKAAAVLISSNTFIDAIGPGADESQPPRTDGCEVTRKPWIESSVRAGHIDGVKKMICRKGRKIWKEYTWTYSIDLTNEGLTYALDRNGRKESCDLVPAK